MSFAEVGAGKAQMLEFWKGGSRGSEGVFVMPRVVATQDHLLVKIHQVVPLTSVHLTILKSYLHFFKVYFKGLFSVTRMCSQSLERTPCTHVRPPSSAFRGQLCSL